MAKRSRLYLRGGTYWCWFYDANGKPTYRSTRCKDKQSAEAVVREFERFFLDVARR